MGQVLGNNQWEGGEMFFSDACDRVAPDDTPRLSEKWAHSPCCKVSFNGKVWGTSIFLSLPATIWQQICLCNLLNVPQNNPKCSTSSVHVVIIYCSKQHSNFLPSGLILPVVRALLSAVTNRPSSHRAFIRVHSWYFCLVVAFLTMISGPMLFLFHSCDSTIQSGRNQHFFFCKVPNSKYVGLCGPHSLPHNCSTMPL